jgi:hypothetical protein
MPFSRLLAAAIFLVVAAGSAFATIRIASGPGEHAPPPRLSRPDFVAPECYRDAGTESACRVALRYLRALDLDRFEEACAQLARDTLDQAGGAAGCVHRLNRSRGKRIRYEIDEARRWVLGITIHFRTQAADRKTPEIQQVMVLAPEAGDLRIVTVQADPYPRQP